MKSLRISASPMSLGLGLALFLSLGTQMATAGVKILSNVTGTAVVDSVAESSLVKVALPDLDVAAATDLASVTLTFHAKLTPGEEVELWIVTEDSQLPWNNTSKSGLQRQDIWIADEATGTLVKFNLTRYVRGALHNKKAPPEFLVRKAPDEFGDWDSLALESSADFRVCVNADAN